MFCRLFGFPPQPRLVFRFKSVCKKMAVDSLHFSNFPTFVN
ncbi:hypothetical protein kac65v162_gp001 [Nodularia phage vB_NspS-kac65v162]|uniref:Uncharacterized protein n=3 Tax=Ravarandavirus kac65v151 TaxID=2845689 RepID=A0A482MHT3_9CAUD|nr:hypothetical protein HWC12_gp001 [Nodularia phage vB_NspS-kac65v151]QBQ73033.1 hypothetical protein kac65v151_gp001 [Nodularia phage vB_NspS-kac65v151]QBQ73239.1 hypothetical protein kac65v161_gp001 [Nodularia phage vB_NspS-kac65v161]QBQ73445.1 hypothetical protein kac65v162_gp001 [Nodularia phage vB_NspS-kac65v162]